MVGSAVSSGPGLTGSDSPCASVPTFPAERPGAGLNIPENMVCQHRPDSVSLIFENLAFCRGSRGAGCDPGCGARAHQAPPKPRGFPLRLSLKEVLPSEMVAQGGGAPGDRAVGSGRDPGLRSGAGGRGQGRGYSQGQRRGRGWVQASARMRVRAPCAVTRERAVAVVRGDRGLQAGGLSAERPFLPSPQPLLGAPGCAPMVGAWATHVRG